MEMTDKYEYTVSKVRGIALASTLSTRVFEEFKIDCFCQAQDGIRDADVTGVQTCALPICDCAAFMQKQQQQQPLFELMEQATIFFEQMLHNHPERDKAVDYLKGRGLSGKAAQFFSIGYAPTGWDNLQKALAPEQDKALIKQLISCGMLIEREDGRTYDRFRDRVMFPIRDLRGRTIAFGGRVLTDEKPKYLNSPETPIFHKGNELYGLYEARKVR